MPTKQLKGHGGTIAVATAKPRPTKPRPTREEDHARTLSVLRTILNAQSKGLLSDEMHVRRLPSQIVLENTTDADRAWLMAKYKGTVESKGWLWHDKNGRVRKDSEEGIFRANLRKKFDDHDTYLPRLEIWKIKVPHVHGSPKGSLVKGKAVWRCGACNLVMREGL